jgi:hypothetical protein
MCLWWGERSACTWTVISPAQAGVATFGTTSTRLRETAARVGGHLLDLLQG